MDAGRRREHLEFAPALRRCRLIRRYKRFLADVETPCGELLTIHCANTGAMTGCAVPGSAAWYSTSPNPRRKYAHTLELVRTAEGDLIGVNTGRANALVCEALAAGLVPGFPSGAAIRREVPVPGDAGRGRLDLLVGTGCGACTYVEVKTVTLKLADAGAFPDAVSARATRHLAALTRLAERGMGATLVYCVLHSGIRSVRPADEIDPAYGAALRRAAAAGVRILALGCRLSAMGIAPAGMLPVRLRSVCAG